MLSRLKISNIVNLHGKRPEHANVIHRNSSGHGEAETHACSTEPRSSIRVGLIRELRIVHLLLPEAKRVAPVDVVVEVPVAPAQRVDVEARSSRLIPSCWLAELCSTPCPENALETLEPLRFFQNTVVVHCEVSHRPTSVVHDHDGPVLREAILFTRRRSSGPPFCVGRIICGEPDASVILTIL